MGETFYSALGVDPGADTESIRRAYREQVKEHHPDVSNAPDAPERFKRLTTARDVLVDDDERTRYDRLGHERYVRRHVESGVWSAGGSAADDGTAGRTSVDRPGARSGSSGSSARSDTSDTWGTTTDRTAWLGEDTPPNRGGNSRSGRNRRRAGHHVAETTGGGRTWQHATRAYRRADTDVDSGPDSVLRSVARGVREVGPWLGVHFVFILSALATAWFAFVRGGSAFGLSLPILAFGIVAFGLVIFLSILHVVAQLYT